MQAAINSKYWFLHCLIHCNTAITIFYPDYALHCWNMKRQQTDTPCNTCMWDTKKNCSYDALNAYDMSKRANNVWECWTEQMNISYITVLYAFRWDYNLCQPKCFEEWTCLHHQEYISRQRYTWYSCHLLILVNSLICLHLFPCILYISVLYICFIGHLTALCLAHHKT
jgi:hypothetical protein